MRELKKFSLAAIAQVVLDWIGFQFLDEAKRLEEERRAPIRPRANCRGTLENFCPNHKYPFPGIFIPDRALAIGSGFERLLDCTLSRGEHKGQTIREAVRRDLGRAILRRRDLEEHEYPPRVLGLILDLVSGRRSLFKPYLQIYRVFLNFTFSKFRF